MHQYKETSLHRDGQTYSNSYWKLGSHSQLSLLAMQTAMKKPKFFCTESHLRPRTLALYHRMQRGLLSYESCSACELRTFSKTRKLVQQSAYSRDADMVAVLEKADDERKFGRFMDLPSELREYIYTLHFQDVGEALPYTPQHPPITLVSHQVREEALPLCYSMCTFLISVRRTSNEHEEPRLSAETESFLEHTSAATLSRIKVPQIETDDWEHNQGHSAVTEWRTELVGHAGAAVTAAAQDCGPLGDERESDEQTDLITAKLPSLNADIRKRDAKHPFCGADIILQPERHLRSSLQCGGVGRERRVTRACARYTASAQSCSEYGKDRGRKFSTYCRAHNAGNGTNEVEGSYVINPLLHGDRPLSRRCRYRRLYEWRLPLAELDSDLPLVLHSSYQQSRSVTEP
ncbi:hypothetical protein LTR36_005084 [Oleoguttula mirabilis]|uniref:Uncharacterized protein n=1 Tax=Oleoguttula mirabilis TaxID=1507867 RepID=A0AAV9JXJ0_9PEZI|nr:hypothetical protein LTR36_005084 [Oleoguttula mirabilis]